MLCPYNTSKNAKFIQSVCIIYKVIIYCNRDKHKTVQSAFTSQQLCLLQVEVTFHFTG